VQLERIDGLVKQGIAEGNAGSPRLFAFARIIYKPTLLSNVHPLRLSRSRRFQPGSGRDDVRTPREAVELANNTVYGLAASVWGESVNLALQAAAQIKAGVVWVNSTNLFDAACSLAAIAKRIRARGGREGLLEYLQGVAQNARSGGRFDSCEWRAGSANPASGLIAL
jgi:aldehyde dehydrogenase (NAD+)